MLRGAPTSAPPSRPRGAALALILTLGPLGQACADDGPFVSVAPPDSTGGDAGCEPPPAGAPPTITLGRATVGATTFEPLRDGDPLPVFDGTQGVVATWIVVRVDGGAAKMRLQTVVTAPDDGRVLASSGALLTPFDDAGCGAWQRDEHMVPFDAVCCAEDYDGLTVDVQVTAVVEGLDPVDTTLHASLELAPFPL